MNAPQSLVAAAIDAKVRARLLEVREQLRLGLELTLGPRTAYVIGDVGRWLGVERHVLHYWEKMFSEYVRPVRGRTPYAGGLKGEARGRRFYSHKETITLGCIHWLLREELYTIAGARRQLALARKPPNAL